MTELVTAEDRENRPAVPESPDEEGAARQLQRMHAEIGGKRGVMQLANEGRREDRGEQQSGVQPDAIAELLRRMPDVLRRTADEVKWRRNSLGVAANGFQPIDYPMF